MDLFILTLTFIVGAIIGSFLNVVGLRLLREESIVLPASHCYSCNEKIKPYDNIPILSWLILGGKCRQCKAPISVQYPLVELFTALLFVGVITQFGLTWQSLFLIYLMCNFVVILITDFREQFIFDINSIGLIPFGLLYSLLNLGHYTGEHVLHFGGASLGIPHIFVSSVLAVVGAFVLFFVLNLFSKLLIGRDGFGEGDTRLLMGVGAFFGAKFMIATFFIGFVVQTVIGMPILFYQWVKQKAFKTLGLMGASILCALMPYFIQAWLPSNQIALISIALVCGLGAMTLVVFSLKSAKQLENAFTYLPFGPALVFAAMGLLFAANSFF